jgi:AraC-like DNA-binding protein
MARSGKNIRRINYLRLLFLVTPILLTTLCFFFFNKPPLNPFPDSKNDLILFNDSINNGNSEINLVSFNKKAVAFKYILGEGYQFAYAGLKIKPKRYIYFDLSDYDYISIKIKAVRGLRIPIVLGTFTTNSDTINDLSFRSSEYIVDVLKETKVVKIHLNQFRTPDWWLSLNKKKELEMENPDYSKVKFINIQSCVLLGKNKEDQVEINGFTFHKDLTSFYYISFFLSLAWYITGGLILFRKKRVVEAAITFNYEKTETVNHFDMEEAAVFDFLTSHYTRQDLTIIEVQNETGISETKISGMIKNKTNLSFKQFLNKLRITESKRLLSETDLQISEVAYKVGYANISHFNRVFKEAESCTPNDFRKKASSTQ